MLNRHAEAAEVRDVNAEHGPIMAAVLDRDVDLATALMDIHLLATEQSVARLLEAGYDAFREYRHDRADGRTGGARGAGS